MRRLFRKLDPVNEVILPFIGACILLYLWYEGIFTWAFIKYILTEVAHP